MTNITHKAKVSGILKKLHELKESFFIIFKKMTIQQILQIAIIKRILFLIIMQQ